MHAKILNFLAKLMQSIRASKRHVYKFLANSICTTKQFRLVRAFRMILARCHCRTLDSFYRMGHMCKSRCLECVYHRLLQHHQYAPSKDPVPWLLFHSISNCLAGQNDPKFIFKNSTQSNLRSIKANSEIYAREPVRFHFPIQLRRRFHPPVCFCLAI